MKQAAIRDQAGGRLGLLVVVMTMVVVMRGRRKGRSSEHENQEHSSE